MKQEKTVHDLIYWLDQNYFITEDNDGSIRYALRQAYAAGYDQRAKELCSHHKKKIVLITKDGREIKYDSIKEAAKDLKLNRDVIDQILMGYNKRTRKHKYTFRYET